MTHFCPYCWQPVRAEDVRCPACGRDLDAFSALPYEEKLLLALRHPVREHRMMAVEVLGRRRSRRALPAFRRLLETERDPYLLREVVRALAAIGGPEAAALLRQAAGHRSRLVRRLAVELGGGAVGMGGEADSDGM